MSWLMDAYDWSERRACQVSRDYLDQRHATDVDPIGMTL
jgi:hypothetical protein